MKPEQQRIAIAEACGWTLCPFAEPLWPKSWRTLSDLPDYLNDLNAIREAILSLPASDMSGKDQISVRYHLGRIRNDPQHWSAWLASPAELSEAFLRALGLWEE